MRREAAARGVSISDFVATTLDDAIQRRTPSAATSPFRLTSVGGNGPRPGIELDRPRETETADDEYPD